MALLGHDLRAAVSEILGGLRLIGQEGLDQDARLQLERVRAAGDGLVRLLDEGLSLAPGEEDIAAHPVTVDLDRMLHDAGLRWSGQARETGLSFELTVAPDVPKGLTLDRVALERVLSNTLSNAMKYAGQGVVRLDVSMAPAGVLRIVVADQGPGFSREAMARLFEFGGRPAGITQPGSGLGLHITRAMTRRLGGRIKVENPAAGGARVTLDLPPESWIPAATERVVGDLPDLTGRNILVADDNATNRSLISHMLATAGASFQIAEDGVAALAWLERETFDLALIDIEMPRLSGLEVIRSLRAGPTALRNLPVIAITADVQRARRTAIYAAGANAILPKPLAGAEPFARALAEVLARPKAAVAAPTNAGLPCQGLAGLLKAAGPAAGRKLLDQFDADLQTARRDLIAGLAAHDVAALRSCTHMLIALAGAAGAVPLHDMSVTLNAATQRNYTGPLAPLGKQILADLDRLIAHVNLQQTRHAEGPQ